MTYKCVHGRLPCGLHPATIVCNCQPTPALNQFRSPVCATVKDCRRGPILCSCWSTFVEQSAYLYHIGRLLGHFQNTLKTFLFRTAYDWHVLLTFSVNSVKRLRSDLSLTLLWKFTYYIHTYIHTYMLLIKLPPGACTTATPLITLKLISATLSHSICLQLKRIYFNMFWIQLLVLSPRLLNFITLLLS